MTGGRQRFGALDVVSFDRRHTRIRQATSLDAALVARR
jgi:hypothetical protein